MDTLNVLLVVVLSAMLILGIVGCYYAIRDIITHIRKKRRYEKGERARLNMRMGHSDECQCGICLENEMHLEDIIGDIEQDRKLLEEWKALQLCQEEAEQNQAEIQLADYEVEL